MLYYVGDFLYALFKNYTGAHFLFGINYVHAAYLKVKNR